MALGNLLEGAGREGGVVGLAAVPAHAAGGRAVRAVRGRDTGPHGAAQQRRGHQQQQQGRGGHGDDGRNTTGSSLLVLYQLNEEKEDR